MQILAFPKDALLLKSSTKFSAAPDQFSIQISNGQFVVFYNLGPETKVRSPP